MFCKNCGKKISDNSVFCEFCGTKLKEDVEVKTEVEVKSEVEKQKVEEAKPQEIQTTLVETKEENQEKGAWQGFAKAGRSLAVVATVFSFVGVGFNAAFSIKQVTIIAMFLSVFSIIFGGLGVPSNNHRGKAITAIIMGIISFAFCVLTNSFQIPLD